MTKTTNARPAAAESAAAPGDDPAGGRPEGVGGYRPVTRERAELLAYFISANISNEETKRALVELLEGLVAAHYGLGGGDVETLAMAAAWRVYEATEHFGEAYEAYRARGPFDPEEFKRRRDGRGSFPGPPD